MAFLKRSLEEQNEADARQHQHQGQQGWESYLWSPAGRESDLFDYTGQDRFYVTPGQKLRFIVMDHAGVSVVLILEAYDEADFNEWLETVSPVVDSINWA